MNEPSEFLSATLPGGIQVVGQPMAGVESAAIGILAGAGARDECLDELGITHFVEQMLFRGTERYDARRLSDALDLLGVEYDTSAGLEMTLVSAVLVGARLGEAIDLLIDVVRRPAFPAEAVDPVRQLLLQELRQREDHPPQKVMDLLRQRYFAGSPLGHDVLGTEETLAALARSDLARYHARWFTAENVVMSVAGNFDWDAVVEQLTRATEGWPTGTPRIRPDVPAVRPGVEAIEREAAQENIALAFPGTAVSDPRFYVGGLLGQALGGVGNSRLYQEVRVKRGLAYAIQGRFDALETTGLYRIYVGTQPERAAESVEVILAELRKLERDGLTEEELRLAKTRLKSQLLMRSESTYARMASNLRDWWFEHRLYTLDEIRERIDAVTLDDVAALVRDLRITENILAVAIGPRSENELFGRLVPTA